MHPTTYPFAPQLPPVHLDHNNPLPLPQAYNLYPDRPLFSRDLQAPIPLRKKMSSEIIYPDDRKFDAHSQTTPGTCPIVYASSAPSSSNDHGMSLGDSNTSASPAALANVQKYGGKIGKHGERDYTEEKMFKIGFLGTCLNVMMFALDQFIITTAVPQIITEFDSTSKLAYLNSALFIPCVGFICLYSQFMMIWRPKWVYLAAVFVFEVGCAICGGARSMDMLIVGRALAGLGGAGMWSATYIIAGQPIPLLKRPTFFGAFGISYVLASIAGPLVGGAFADTGPQGWRWCFWINLPLGGVTFLLLLWALPAGECLPPLDGSPDGRSIWLKVLTIDWVGSILSMAAVSCFAIALQLAGVTHAWGSTNVVILLAMSPVLSVFFIIWSHFRGAKAQLPVLMLSSGHIWSGLWISFLGYGVIVNVLYYIPLYLESVKGKSAVEAGVILIAYQIPLCAVTIIAGKAAEKTGHLWPLIFVGSIIAAIGAGVFLLIKDSTSAGAVGGLMIPAAIGMGCLINSQVVAVQADYTSTPHLIPHATAVQNWFGFIGRIVSITVATNVFENKLILALAKIPRMNPQAAAMIAASPGAIRDGTIPIEMQALAEAAYSKSIMKVWEVNLALALALVVAVLFLKRQNLKTVGKSPDEEFNMQQYEGQSGSDANAGKV